MKKFLTLVIVLSFCLSGCSNNDENLSNNEVENSYNYTASRTTILNNTNTTNDNDNTNKNNNNDDINTNNTNDNNTNATSDINIETDLSSFSTKIYTPNDNARQNNIQITCSKLNGTIVKPRRNFFFL